jgi:RNA polymerase sigma factor (sigma-70 family)
MQESDDRALIDVLAAGGPVAWQTFLDACSPTVFRVVSLFADTYDDRMDLFLFVCTRLHDDDMRRLRSFRFHSESPCRFSTWLAVVVKNLAVDYLRSRDGRFRPFRNVDAMDEIDRLVFEYHLRDGRSLEEVRHFLEKRHDIRIGEVELAGRAERVEAALSANQRWRLLARLAARQEPLPLDPVSGAARLERERAIPLADEWGDPEKTLRSREADRALHSALEAVPPRERLAVALRYRDGLSVPQAASALDVTPAEAERLAREGIRKIRESLGRSGMAALDFEKAVASSRAAGRVDS